MLALPKPIPLRERARGVRRDIAGVGHSAESRPDERELAQPPLAANYSKSPQFLWDFQWRRDVVCAAILARLEQRCRATSFEVSAMLSSTLGYDARGRGGSPLSSLFGRYDHPAGHLATYKGRRRLTAFLAIRQIRSPCRTPGNVQGTAIARRSPRKSQRAELPHWAPALGNRTSGNGCRRRTARQIIHSTASVRLRFVSLRQSHRVKYSLPVRQRAKIPNKHGPSRENLCTAAPPPRPKIRSLGPSFSKPLDFAILVRIS